MALPSPAEKHLPCPWTGTLRDPFTAGSSPGGTQLVPSLLTQENTDRLPFHSIELRTHPRPLGAGAPCVTLAAQALGWTLGQLWAESALLF